MNKIFPSVDASVVCNLPWFVIRKLLVLPLPADRCDSLRRRGLSIVSKFKTNISFTRYIYSKVSFLCTFVNTRSISITQHLQHIENDTTGCIIYGIPSGHYIQGDIHTKSELAMKLGDKRKFSFGQY